MTTSAPVVRTYTVEHQKDNPFRPAPKPEQNPLRVEAPAPQTPEREKVPA